MGERLKGKRQGQINISGLDMSELKNVFLKNNLEGIKESCVEATRAVRESIVNSWFGKFNSESLNAATVYHPYSTLFDDGRATFVVHSYISLDKYTKKKKADEWVKRHKDEIGEPKWESNEYVLRLQLFQGVIGLPEIASVRKDGWIDPQSGKPTKWINPNPHVQAPLHAVITNSSEWDKWEDKVIEIAKTKGITLHK